jgi:hypothetical protein
MLELKEWLSPKNASWREREAGGYKQSQLYSVGNIIGEINVPSCSIKLCLSPG